VNGHYRGKWGLHGEVVIGTDLSRAQYLSADSAKSEAVLLLPTPQVIATKVNHDRSEELYLRQQTVVPLSSPKVFRDEVWMQADQKIRRLGRTREEFTATVHALILQLAAISPVIAFLSNGTPR